jgi:hypothetical protein
MADLDQLYSLPLDDFTAARDALASELRSAGDKAGAAEVKKLRKPSLAAWAVNQVARAKPDAMRTLFELRQGVEEAQSASEMRSAAEERRRLIAELVGRAEKVLTDAGRATGANTMQAITQTFHAGDNDRDELLHGRLTKELTPSGFGGFSLAFEEDEPTESDVEDPKLEEKRRRARELAEEADDAGAEAERLEKEFQAAERAMQRARAQADAARRTAEQTRKHAERAAAELKRSK